MENQIKKLENAIQRFPQWVAQKVQPHSPFLSNIIQSIDIDAPFSLTFSFLCVIVHLLSSVFGSSFATLYFGIPSLSIFNFLSPLSYFRMISQIFGHSSWQHLSGNLVNILLVGPSCEREYGCYNIFVIVLLTAVSSSLSHIFFGPRNSIQLGASGVVFMFILLSSLIETKSHRIPLTFICQVGIWCSHELISNFMSQEGGGGISHLAHLTGALVGAFAGYYFQQQKERNVVTKYLKIWSAKLR
jgi:membrane associated rhomboid family serine protease